MIAYDLDGIICEDYKFTELDLLLLKVIPKIWWKHLGEKKKILFRPKDDALIITGRPIMEKRWTLAWLRNNWIYNRVEFYKIKKYGIISIKDIVEFKSQAILDNKVSRYYESSYLITEMLKERLKNKCKVIWFRRVHV